MNSVKFTEDPTTHCPSPNDVRRAAADNPYPREYMSLWKTGRCPWEEALAAAVVSLIDYVVEDSLRRKPINHGTNEETPQVRSIVSRSFSISVAAIFPTT